MNLIAFLANNFVMLFMLLGLIIIIFISVHLTKATKFYTRIAIILLFFASLFYNLELASQGHEGYTIWRPILTACKYSIYPLILYFLIMVTVPETKVLTLKQKIILLIPEIISVPLYFTSEWTHLICYFPNNAYQGGPLKYLPYFIFVFYLVIFLIQNFISLRNYSRKNRLILLFISIGSLVGVVLYKIYDQTDDYTPIFSASLILYFLFLYIHLSSLDPLTGLMNRQSYYQDIETNGDRVIGVISADLNELKYLNDTFGHSAGDEALIVTAKTLDTIRRPFTTIFRVGGDEFAIFYYKGGEDLIKSDIMDLKSKLLENNYSCSFGYSMRQNEKQELDEIIKLADKDMFVDKARDKALILANGGTLHTRE